MNASFLESSRRYEFKITLSWFTIKLSGCILSIHSGASSIEYLFVSPVDALTTAKQALENAISQAETSAKQFLNRLKEGINLYERKNSIMPNI